MDWAHDLKGYILWGHDGPRNYNLRHLWSVFLAQINICIICLTPVLLKFRFFNVSVKIPKERLLKNAIAENWIHYSLMILFKCVQHLDTSDQENLDTINVL